MPPLIADGAFRKVPSVLKVTGWLVVLLPSNVKPVEIAMLKPDWTWLKYTLICPLFPLLLLMPRLVPLHVEPMELFMTSHTEPDEVLAKLIPPVMLLYTGVFSYLLVRHSIGHMVDVTMGAHHRRQVEVMSSQ